MFTYQTWRLSIALFPFRELKDFWGFLVCFCRGLTVLLRIGTFDIDHNNPEPYSVFVMAVSCCASRARSDVRSSRSRCNDFRVGENVRSWWCLNLAVVGLGLEIEVNEIGMVLRTVFLSTTIELVVDSGVERWCRRWGPERGASECWPRNGWTSELALSSLLQFPNISFVVRNRTGSTITFRRFEKK